MSRVIPHMGAHLRAYHFLCFQTQIGYRDNRQITLSEVAEVMPMSIQQGWLKPRPRGDYDKYLAGGNLHLITKDFKGKGRLRALWDITGYALQEGMWTNPTTVEMHSYQLAVFWGMKAPKELPTLPGIGGDGNLYVRFDTPSIFWSSKYIESLKVKKIVLDEEDKNTSATQIVPKAVSKAPVVTRQPWDPVLGDSVHAHAWWTLSKDEAVAVINEQKSRASKRPASQIAAPKGVSAPKGSVAKVPTTTSKTGADPPPKEGAKAKAAVVSAPAAVPVPGMELAIPLPELTGPPGPQQTPPIEYRGNARTREPSQVRGKRRSKGQSSRIPHAATALVGKGTPSVPPEEAVGAYATDSVDRSTAPQEPLAQSATTKGYTPDRSRSRDPPREPTSVVPIPQPQVVMNVPDYLLPIMASAGVGHLSLDQDRTLSMGDIPPPKAAQPSNPSIRDFFESFTQAQDREEQVKAIQQFTAELLNAPPMSGSPASQEAPDPNVTTPTGVVSSSHASPDAALAASRESSTPQEESREDAQSSRDISLDEQISERGLRKAKSTNGNLIC